MPPFDARMRLRTDKGIDMSLTYYLKSSSLRGPLGPEEDLVSEAHREVKLALNVQNCFITA